MPNQLKFLKPLDKYEKARIAKQVKMENIKKRREEEKKKSVSEIPNTSTTRVAVSDNSHSGGGMSRSGNNVVSYEHIPALKKTDSNSSIRNKNQYVASERIPVLGNHGGGGRSYDRKSISSLPNEDISRMYQNARNDSSNYSGIDRIFNKEAKESYDTYQRLYDENKLRGMKSAYQTMTDRGAYDDVLSYGQALSGVNARYTPESAQALEESKRALREKGYSDDEILSLGDLADTLAMEKRMQEVQDFSDKHQIWGSISSIASNMMKPADLLGKSIEYIQGKPIEKDDYILGDITSNLREGASKDMGKVGKFAYNVGMGIADSITSRALTGLASPFVMAAGAAEDTTQDALNRGIAPTDAFKTGLASGAAEAAFEKLELDKLQAFKQVAPKSVASFLGNIGKQMLNEGVSEGATELANTISDYAINGNNSNFALSVDNYESQNISHEDALDAALGDALKNVGLNALGGMLSGGVMGAGYQAIGSLNNRSLNPFEGQDIKETVEQPSLNPFDKQNDVQSVAETVSQPSLNTFENQKNQISQTDRNITTLDVDNANNSISNLRENVNASKTMAEDIGLDNDVSTQYSAKKIDGFADLNKQLDKLVGMYKGNAETQSNLESMKSALNEYLQTGNQDAIDRAMVLADTIDESLKGHSYTYKRSGKNSVKAQNRKQSVTYNDGDFTNAILDYGQELRDTAVNNASGLNPLDYQKQSDYKVMAEDTGLNPNGSGTEAEFKVRGYNNSIVNKSDMPDVVKNEFIENPQFYQVLKNKDTQAMADQIFDETDLDMAKAAFDTLVDKKNPTAIPLGYKIASQMQENGNVNEAVEILRKMSEKLTESGQFSQAAAITLMNNDPVTALQYVTREFDRLNTSGREKYKNKWKDFELNEDEKAMFSNLKPGDKDGIQKAYDTIYSRFRKQYPSTFIEKAVELRRIGMLLNVRTNVRNVVSNALLQPVRWSTDRVSALGQNAIKLINPDFNKTQSVFVGKNAKNLSDQAWNTVKDAILNEDSSRYNDTQKAIRDKQMFKGTKASQFIDTITGGAITKVNKMLGKDVTPSLMETARNFTYWLLEKGDNVFVKNNFKSRMASYIQAQGITDLENIPADAYTLATQEALKATFKDDNALTQALSAVKKNTGLLGEVVMPFTKTPANLAMRGIDYSPAGIISSVKQLAKSNRTQEDVSLFMDNLSKQFVGTSAIALGYFLAKAGVISGELSDDKDEAAFQKQQGQLPYAIHIGQNYYSYDWAQPASIPIILGATWYQTTEDSENKLNAVLQGMTAATDAWFNLSPLQNLEEIFGGYGTPAENLLDTVADIPNSYVPAQLGATARIVDPVQRQAFSNGDTLGTVKNNIIAKIPGLSRTLPASYDTWGNEIKRSNSTGEAAFAQLLNPGQLGNSSVTPIDGEIQRLYDETGSKAVFPKKASWSYNVGGETIKLDNKLYSQMQKTIGSTSYEIANEFINSDAYEMLSDEKKASILSDIYSFSDAIGKSELLGYDIANSDKYAKKYAVYKESGAKGLAQYLSINANLDGSSIPNKIQVLQKMDLSDEEMGAYIRQSDSNISQGAVQAYDKYGDKGIYDFYLYQTNANVDGSSNTSKSELFNYLNRSTLTEQERADYYYFANADNFSKKETASYNDSGTLGAYRVRMLESMADSDGNGNVAQKELEAYLKICNFTKEQKNYYWNLFFPNSKTKPNF